MNVCCKIYPEDNFFDNLEDAVEFMKKTNFLKEVQIYNIDDNKAYHIAIQLYPIIREYNKGKQLNDQILPSYPFGFRGIKGCLGVQCYSVMMGTYEKNRECIPMFSSWNADVLDTVKQTVNIRPGMKALSSLAMLGHIISERG